MQHRKNIQNNYYLVQGCTLIFDDNKATLSSNKSFHYFRNASWIINKLKINRINQRRKDS